MQTLSLNSRSWIKRNISRKTLKIMASLLRCVARPFLQHSSKVVDGLRSGGWFGHCKMNYIFTLKVGWAAFTSCFAEQSEQSSTNQSAVLHLVQCEQTVKSTKQSKFIVLLLSLPALLKNTTGCDVFQYHHSSIIHFTDYSVSIRRWAFSELSLLWVHY